MIFFDGLEAVFFLGFEGRMEIALHRGYYVKRIRTELVNWEIFFGSLIFVKDIIECLFNNNN